jgi:hypothetical protein
LKVKVMPDVDETVPADVYTLLPNNSVFVERSPSDCVDARPAPVLNVFEGWTKIWLYAVVTSESFRRTRGGTHGSTNETGCGAGWVETRNRTRGSNIACDHGGPGIRNTAAEKPERVGRRRNREDQVSKSRHNGRCGRHKENQSLSHLQDAQLLAYLLGPVFEGSKR